MRQQKKSVSSNLGGRQDLLEAKPFTLTTLCLHRLSTSSDFRVTPEFTYLVILVVVMLLPFPDNTRLPECRNQSLHRRLEQQLAQPWPSEDTTWVSMGSCTAHSYPHPSTGPWGLHWERSLTFSLFTFLIAHLAPVSLSVTSLTIPKLPCPNILPKV